MYLSTESGEQKGDERAPIISDPLGQNLVAALIQVKSIDGMVVAERAVGLGERGSIER